MPSIEIICIGQREPMDFWYMPFAVEAESELVSHRENPPFQMDFDGLTGCIYHLGGPCLRYPPVWAKHSYTAAGLCTEWWETIRFKPRYVPWVDSLLKRLLIASPEGRVLFTSDYQFGPKPRRYKRPVTLEQFGKRHDEGRLYTNTAVLLTRAR